MSIADKVRGMVALLTDGDLIGDGAHLTSDLGLDSLDITMIAGRLEEELGLDRINGEEIRNAATIGGVIDLVERKLA